MSTYKPGPWIAVFHQRGKEVPFSELNKSDWYDSTLETSDGKLILAHADYATKSDAENFTLMAAAPDLLESLEQAVNQLKIEYEFAPFDSRIEFIKKLEAAISKAKGKKS